MKRIKRTWPLGAACWMLVKGQYGFGSARQAPLVVSIGHSGALLGRATF